MQKMNRDEWIEKAREFVRRKGADPYDRLMVTLMADFAIEAVKLDGWVEIKSEDDVPRDVSAAKPYLFLTRDEKIMHIRTDIFPYTGIAGMVETYSHYTLIPAPPTPVQEGE